MSQPYPVLGVLALWLLTAVHGQAQPFRNGGGGGGLLGGLFDGGRRGGGNNGPLVRIEGGAYVNQDTVRTARETVTHSVDFPPWTLDPLFKDDSFAFARLVFHSPGYRLGWWLDYPDADLNLSFRLHQVTSLKVDPDGRVLRPTDADLFKYPLIYLVHVEYMQLSDREVLALREYLNQGGVLFIGDFWDSNAWANLEQQMARVLPGRTWTDLPPDHPLFHCVFDLPMPLSKLQVPTNSAVVYWNRNYDPNDPNSRATLPRGPDSLDMHVRAWLDNKGRIMVLALHNTDISDGWEREAEDEEYFQLFSETRAYPLAVNIIYYVMTH